MPITEHDSSFTRADIQGRLRAAMTIITEAKEMARRARSHGYAVGDIESECYSANSAIVVCIQRLDPKTKAGALASVPPAPEAA